MKTKDEWIFEANKKHDGIYSYDDVEYKNLSTKVLITCPQHGNFSQTPKSHLRGRGCPTCAGKKENTETYTRYCNSVFGGYYGYNKTVYKTAHDFVTVTCPEHGEFKIRAYSHKNGQGCPECGGTKTGTLQTFIKKANEAWGGLYGYEKSVYVNNKTKLLITCKEHGDFLQTPNSHLRGRGCPVCGGNMPMTQEILEKKGNECWHGFFSYKNACVINSKTPVRIDCPEHGEFWQRPNDHLTGHGCKMCARKESSTEREVKDYITGVLGEEIIESDRSMISPKELDIIIPRHKIAIEFNGLFYHSTYFNVDRSYHLGKTEMVEKSGYRLIHIYEDEWLEKRGRVESFLRALVGKEKTKYDARKCKVIEVSSKKFKSFLDENHIQGATESSIRIGLECNGTVVACMGFRKSGEDYILNRFATSALVRGGFTKLLNHFKKNYEWSSIISYADRRWSQGNVYKTCGFDLTHISPPSFDYTRDRRRFNRQQYMKYKIKDKLPFFDPSLTEKENMEHNGFYQIWNCGYLKFEMKNTE